MNARKELVQLIEANRNDSSKYLSLNMVARSIGISEAALSQWINKKYAGDNAGIEKKVQAFLNQYWERASRPSKQLPFIETKISKKIFEIARLCQIENEIGLIVGKSGIGKTRALKEFCLHNPNIILIEADMTFTAKVMISEINRKLGIDGYGGLHDLFEQVVTKLEGTNRMIIVDEAEHLPIRAIDILRRIADRTGCGILICGLPQLRTRLQSLRGDYAYIFSRIGIATVLDAPAQKDVETLVKTIIPDANGICEVFYEKMMGSIRILEKLIYRAQKLAQINKMPINKLIISKASEYFNI